MTEYAEYKLLFPPFSGGGALELKVRLKKDTEVVDAGAVRRLLVKTRGFTLDIGEPQLVLIERDEAEDGIDLTVRQEGAGWRAVAGAIRVQLTSGLKKRLPRALGNVNNKAELTAEGLEVTVAGVVMRVDEQTFRPTPDGIRAHVEQALGDQIKLAAIPNWDAWRSFRPDATSDADSEPEVTWRSPTEAAITISRSTDGQQALLVQAQRVALDTTRKELIFYEGRRSRDSKPDLTLQINGAAWSWTTAEGGLPMQLVADRQGPQTAAAGEEALWLRVQGREWLQIEGVTFSESAVEAEGRPVAMFEARAQAIAEPSPHGPGPRVLAALLLDNTQCIEVVYSRTNDKWKLSQVRLYDPGVRFTMERVAHLGRSMLVSNRPPCDSDQTPPTDAVWLTPRLASGRKAPAAAFRLLRRGRDDWQLATELPLVAWRRAEIPLDTPPAWAQNDPDVGSTISPNRGLLPQHKSIGSTTITIRPGCVVLPSSETFAIERFSEGDRPSFGLGERYLGLELHTDSGQHAYLHRHAVAALDEGYRSVADALKATGESPKVGLKATYVDDRTFGEKSSLPTDRKLNELQDPPGAPPEAETWAWNAPQSYALKVGESPLGFSLVLESYQVADRPGAENAKGQLLRRWGISGHKTLCGLSFEAVALEREKDGWQLLLQVEGVAPAPNAPPDTDKPAAAGELWLRLTEKSEQSFDVSAVSDKSHLLLSGGWNLISPAHVHAVVAFELKNILLTADSVRAEQTRVWHGSEPALLAVELKGVHTAVSAVDGKAVARLTDDGSDVITRTFDPRGRLAALSVKHELPTLALREHIIEAPQGLGHARPRFVIEGPTGPSFQPQIEQLGHRVIVTWAGESAEMLPETRLFAGDDVWVTHLSRLFLELHRQGDQLDVVGGMIGWKAGKLFGLLPVNQGEPLTTYPEVTLVWPAEEPLPSQKRPYLELNGRWKATAGKSSPRHELIVHFWDQRVVLNTPPATRRADAMLPEAIPDLNALVQHELTVDVEHEPVTVKGFAFHTARVIAGSPRMLDLSALVFLEQHIRRREVIEGMRRRTLMAFEVNRIPPPRAKRGDPALAGASIHMVCGSAFSDALSVDQRDLRPGSRQAPRLDWAEGLARIEAQPSSTATTNAASGDGPRQSAKVSFMGGGTVNLEALANAALWSTLTDDGGVPSWLPCPVTDVLQPKPRQWRPPRIWILSSEGLTLLHSIAAEKPRQVADPEEQKKIEADAKKVATETAARLLALSGWHREAALETWTSSGSVEWTLLDSTLLNRSISLHRFTAGGEPMTTPTRRETTATRTSTDTHDGASWQLRMNDGSTPTLENEYGTTQGIAELRLPGPAVARGLSIGRCVPFEVEGAGEGKTPLRPSVVAGKLVSHGSFIPVWPERDSHFPSLVSVNAAPRRALLPDTAWLTPRAPRPGERTSFRVSGWSVSATKGEPPQTQAEVTLTGGVAFQRRFARWNQPSVEIVLEGGNLAPRRRHGLDVCEVRWLAKASLESDLAHERHPLDGASPVVLAHGPDSDNVHPEDVIVIWAFGVGGPADAAAGPADAAQIVATLVSKPLEGEALGAIAQLRVLDVDALDGSPLTPPFPPLDRNVTLKDLAAGLHLLPKLPTQRFKLTIELRLPISIDWRKGEHALELRWQDGDKRLRIDTAAPRARASTALVGLMSKGRLIAFGPEPASRWIPALASDTGSLHIRWTRPVQWTDWRAPGEPPVDDLFYLEPSGARVGRTT